MADKSSREMVAPLASRRQRRRGDSDPPLRSVPSDPTDNAVDEPGARADTTAASAAASVSRDDSEAAKAGTDAAATVTPDEHQWPAPDPARSPAEPVSDPVAADKGTVFSARQRPSRRRHSQIKGPPASVRIVVDRDDQETLRYLTQKSYTGVAGNKPSAAVLAQAAVAVFCADVIEHFEPLGMDVTNPADVEQRVRSAMRQWAKAACGQAVSSQQTL